MSLWRQLRHGLRVLTRRGTSDRDLDDEFAHYVEELAASYREQGVSEAEALRRARMAAGSALSARDQVRSAAWESAVSHLVQDVCYAARRLRRTPGFTLAATLTLALGIGATAAIFTIANAVVLKPLPYPQSERLVALWHSAPGIHLENLRMAPSLYFTYREEGRVFEKVALWNGNRSTVTGLGDPEEAPTLFVTSEFLDVLRVRPALGRGFLPTDGQPEAEPTVILAHNYWMDRFGGSPTVLGRRLVLDNRPHTIIGVLPRDFEFMDEEVSLVVPSQYRREALFLIQFTEDGIARLKPGVTLAQANADAARCLPLAQRKFSMNPVFSADAFAQARIEPRIRFLKDHLIGDIGESLWILMGAVAVLLLIACANVANLLLVRAAGRSQEITVRYALGAGAWSISRDILAESLLLGFLGGGLGLALCLATLGWVRSSGLTNLPRIASVHADASTVLFTIAASIASGILFGMIPAWKNLARGCALQRVSGRTMTQGRDHHRVQGALLVVQIALAMILLVSSGLMLRTFRAMRDVDPGFHTPEQVEVVRVSVPAMLEPSVERTMALEQEVRRRFAEIPGVTSVAITTSAPMEGGGNQPFYAADRDLGAGQLPPVRDERSISPGFAASIGSHLTAGRDLTWAEVSRGAAFVLISDNMAREIWGSAQAALGKRIRVGPTQPWQEIVGVLADIRDYGVTHPAPTTVYWPLFQKLADGSFRISRNLDIVVRSQRAGSEALVQDLRRTLADVNPAIPLANVRTLDSIYRRSMARTSFLLALLAVAGLMALLMGVVGIYGVIAYSVAQRTKEIGIRIALGATRHGISGLFVRRGLRLALIGAAAGVLGSVVTTRLMQSLLFGVGSTDPITYTAMFALLVGCAVVASWLPAAGTAKVDPSKTLRADG